MEPNKDALRDAEKMARLLAQESRWDKKKSAVWIAVFIGEVRWMAAAPPGSNAKGGMDWPLDDDLPF